MWGIALATTLLFAGQISAGASSRNAGLVMRKVNSLETDMKRYVESLVEPVEEEKRSMEKREANMTTWNLETQAACSSALSLMNGTTTNPSGMAVCYNIPTLDSTTGVFEADLRLYMIAPATGDFASIPTENVMVALNYAGATVSAVNSTQLKARTDESLISWPRGEKGVEKRAAMPVETQVYYFVGQINKAQLTTGATNATLEKLVTPQVTLTGTATNGQTVNTTLSSSDATFVYGVFSRAVSDGSTFTKSQPQIAPIQTLVVAKDAPFIVPGTAILIFPIGGIITAIWTVLFVGAIGYGTYGRMQFADQFKRRTNAANKGNTARI
ncbi:hypothetical protein PVAG01_11059 [Phlyctema vagabunda]|uniref:Uncharacterized protein n=1 Tax=Phlyctema vagabunda TaxID=108571 RepID=A0ABR4P414_9HELO